MKYMQTYKRAVLFLCNAGLAMAILAGCAAPQHGQPVWRDLQARGDATKLRTQFDLDQDAAQCDYELAQAQSSAPQRPQQPIGSGPYYQGAASIGTALFSGPAPGFFQRCMQARGWEYLGSR